LRQLQLAAAGDTKKSPRAARASVELVRKWDCKEWKELNIRCKWVLNGVFLSHLTKALFRCTKS